MTLLLTHLLQRKMMMMMKMRILIILHKTKEKGELCYHPHKAKGRKEE